ncbi:MAG: cysteine--tRNA ligase [Thermodesulfobacteriota bacterium]
MTTLLDFIGNTPLVEIRRICPRPGVRILAKLEYMNPGGSIKDRAALYMIEEGEKSGLLTKDKIVIEATSGNTGIGLAMVCAIKGYRLCLAMSENASEERKRILKGRGAEILLTPGHLGTDGAIEEVYRLVRENPDKYYMTDQFNNEANWKAHYYGTAEEIWRQTEGRIDTMVATLGTSGTAMGLARRLKELKPDIRMVGVEPFLGHKIQGLKNMKESYQPEIYSRKWLDDKPNIDDEEAFAMARRLAAEEGLFVGMSSGAAMAVACAEAMRLEKGTVVTIFPDSGERYLSTTLFAVRETVDIRLYNTATRQKENFVPLSPGRVSMYSCGPTANARMSLGHCRRMVFADVLSRYLIYRGYAVRHIVNITDFDDNTIEGAEKAGKSLTEFTRGYIDHIKQDLAALGVKPAEKYPLPSEEFPEMVDMAEKLVARGVAYEKLRSVYFDISSLGDYGDLSRVDADKIRLGATVDLDEYEKDNPRDFTLLKRARLGELKKGLYVQTKWGNVRPSLHLQCAAMSRKYLGDQFDIHTGSFNLVFPHHENEQAISRALTGKTPARFWIHCETVLSEESGAWKPAVMTIEEALAAGLTGRQLRYWFVSVHYRKPLTFSRESVDMAARSLARLDNCVRALAAIAGKPSGDKPEKERATRQEIDQIIYNIRQGVVDAMDDDLNVSEALASIFKNIKQINTFLADGALDGADAQKIMDAFAQIDQVLNLFDFSEPAADTSARVQALMRQRDQARKEKNWALADELRKTLQEMGVAVVDTKRD